VIVMMTAAASKSTKIGVAYFNHSHRLFAFGGAG
jgi:hypothetical protein